MCRVINPTLLSDFLQKKRQEQAEINARVDKMFPDLPQPKKEPYLTEEELFGFKNKPTGQPADAIDKLLEQKQGFVPKAANKEGVGDIDFVWGKHESPSGTKKKGSGVGIKHILERHNEQGYDGKNFVKDLPVALDGGNVYTKQNHPGRYYIGDGSKEAVIRTDYDGKKRHWLGSAYYLEAPSQASTGFRTYDRTTADKQFFPLSDLRRNSNIISPSQTNLNPTHQAIKAPLSYDEWLEELKRKRRNLGWW